MPDHCFNTELHWSARVHHQLRLCNDTPVVVIAIGVADVLQWRVVHVQVIVAALANVRETRIVLAHFRSALLEQFDTRQRRSLAHIVDVLLVCHPRTTWPKT
jgi:hypothetical protein